MIEDTLGDVSSRHSFNGRAQARCVVLYDRNVEFDWECPVASALLAKFRGKGWKGQVFILKGHYREFADSFEKWITGGKRKGLIAAGSESDPSSLGGGGTSHTTGSSTEVGDKEYEEWLKEFDESGEGLGGRRITELGPAKREERARAVDQRQKDLEKELEARFPALWRKAAAMRGESEKRVAGDEAEAAGSRGIEGGPSATTTTRAEHMGDESGSPTRSSPPPPFSATADTDTAGATSSQFQGGYDKAQLVEPLISGLQKMREASGLGLGLVNQDPAFAEGSSGHPHQCDSALYGSGKVDSYDQHGLTDGYNDNCYDGATLSESWQGVSGGSMVGGTVSPMPPEWQQDESGPNNYGGGSQTGTEGEIRGAKKTKKRTQVPLWERLRGGGR